MTCTDKIATSKYQRRSFLRGVGGLLVPGIILSPTQVYQVMKNKGIVVVVEGVPKDNNAVFASVNEFLAKYGDESTKSFCDRFIDQGLLKSVESELSEDGRSILVTQKFNSYEGFLKFREIWHEQMKHTEQNKAVVYTDVKKFFDKV